MNFPSSRISDDVPQYHSLVFFRPPARASVLNLELRQIAANLHWRLNTEIRSRCILPVSCVQELVDVIEGVKTLKALEECMNGDRLSSFCNEDSDPPQVHIQPSDR